MSYEEALKYLQSLMTFGSQLGLVRIKELLKLMGNPQNSYKTIHVTGTNGKGSTSAMIASMLTASGISTALYTSPHLTRYTERMNINGEEAAPEDFARAIDYTAKFVQQMIEQEFEHPTEFEVVTAAAFYFFAEKNVEVAVIEVGLGGLLDSTNVIIPEVSVITNVTLEHMDRCGNTIEEIACHKAGIIKQGRPVITAAQGPALAVIRQKAAEAGSVLNVYDKDFFSHTSGYDLTGQQLELTDLKHELSVRLPLMGEHQAVNAALAWQAVSCLGKRDERITKQNMRQGLESTKWPGRFEVRRGQPTVIFDGAHNPAGIKVLRQTLNDYLPGRAIVFVLGILRDKAISEMLTTLLTSGDKVIVTLPLSERACPAAQLVTAIEQQKLISAPAYVAEDFSEAFRLACQLAGAEGIVCVTGSLYLIGVVRQCVARQ
ncbi:dihydrofolate synthase/folylpolyglutamate synthase [Sporomusaceae bacterium BoRhaA]|uniref:bifunctional folylpolyglutamate synthase/dihydrofolate synthase n=1 Tax=Pelorhabdus rhamnosifermentans TaxID=2772457 RepID=UPI001C05FBDA|nr:folylpolyglutamate synthase/dihydrofolate synthase family protein [Pelorhabdus rhamnosifermentans]MBU2699757.1 dihydrofolate synthase/folylpolyglutamate synthase [Pelorhabdus rhamnosifermentans]